MIYVLTDGRSIRRIHLTRIVKKPDERRTEIVQSARSLFNTVGYDSTTMMDVMNELGIAKGTIYHYFRSKEDLLASVIDQMTGEVLERMQLVIDFPAGNALEQIHHLIIAGNIAGENEEVMKELHRPNNIAMHTTMLAEVVKQSAPLYAAVIQRGCDEGIFQVENPLEAAEFFLTSFQFLMDTGIHQWGEDDLARRALALPGLIESILKSKPGSFQFLNQY